MVSRRRSRRGAILIGTSSWTDPGYLEEWYPKGMRRQDLLPYYARYFPLVEVNSTFYAVPKPETAARWVEQTPEDFVFDVKLPKLLSWHSMESVSLPREIRHLARPKGRGVERSPKLVKALIKELVDALEPLERSGKLGAVLLQLSPAFSPRRHKLDELDSLLDELPWPTAVEFRNRGWVEDERVASTIEYLARRGAAFVNIDGPKAEHFTVMPEVWTANIDALAYVRCHGRNAEGYIRGRSVPERFDYDYPLKELKEIGGRAQQLAERARKVHVLFNNNKGNYAPKAASRLQRLLFAEART